MRCTHTHKCVLRRSAEMCATYLASDVVISESAITPNLRVSSSYLGRFVSSHCFPEQCSLGSNHVGYTAWQTR